MKVFNPRRLLGLALRSLAVLAPSAALGLLGRLRSGRPPAKRPASRSLGPEYRALRSALVARARRAASMNAAILLLLSLAP